MSMTRQRTHASLSASRSATTLRVHWLMDQKQKIEISERVRALKKESGETNESIADAVGVKERTVAGWISPTNPKAMTYDNAKKVAALFNRSVDYVWRGNEDVVVPADFMERFSELERQVQEMRSGRAVDAARQASRKSQKKSADTQTAKAKKRRGA